MRLGFRLEVWSLCITRARWAVEAAVTNTTGVSYAIDRAFRRLGETRVSARRLTSELIATRFEPPLPQILYPRARWSGTFSTQGCLRSGSSVRVAFGRFRTTETPPPGLPTHLMAVTRRAARLG